MKKKVKRSSDIIRLTGDVITKKNLYRELLKKKRTGRDPVLFLIEQRLILNVIR